MKRIIPVFIMLAAIVVVIIIFFKKNYNIENIGNTKVKIKNLQTYILQISSYEAMTEITVTSNKTTNIYKVRQKESLGNIFEQEVIEPETIARYSNQIRWNKFKTGKYEIKYKQNIWKL